LNNEIYSSPDYIESGLEKENIYIHKLIIIIENLLKKEVYNDSHKITKKVNSYELASFIVMNFISMIQMPYFDYVLFERILKELIH
jgi:hypothetical protein